MKKSFIFIFIVFIFGCENKEQKEAEKETISETHTSKTITSFLFFKQDMTIAELLEYLKTFKIKHSSIIEEQKYPQTRFLMERAPMQHIKIYDYKASAFKIDTLQIYFLDSTIYSIEYIKSFHSNKSSMNGDTNYENDVRKQDSILNTFFKGLCEKYDLPDEYGGKPNYYESEIFHSKIGKEVKITDWENWTYSIDDYFYDERDKFGNPLQIVSGGNNYFWAIWGHNHNESSFEITLQKDFSKNNISKGYDKQTGFYLKKEGWVKSEFMILASSHSNKISSILEKYSSIQNHKKSRKDNESKTKFDEFKKEL